MLEIWRATRDSLRGKQLSTPVCGEFWFRQLFPNFIEREDAGHPGFVETVELGDSRLRAVTVDSRRAHIGRWVSERCENGFVSLP